VAGSPSSTFSLPTLTAAFKTPTGLFGKAQPAIIVPESAYNSTYSATYTDTYTGISDDFITYTPAGATSTTTTALGRKAIQELFTTDYGRMNATLGTELPLTNFLTQTTIPLSYIDPPTEIINDGETQIWKITHNGVDTHSIHFHLFNVQVINRMGWDGTVRAPDPNELGWKETVRMNPLEDITVALKPTAPTVPFAVPNSVRLLDVTQPAGTTTQFTGIDPLTNLPVTVTNELTNFGWEYVWHCHLLGHEENDMMRPIVFNVAPAKAVMVSPAAGSVLLGASTTFTWSAGSSVAQAWIWVGTTAGGQNLGSYGGAGVTSATPTNLPTNGSTVYVRLWSFINGAWLYNDYTYTAATTAAPTGATMISPASGGVLGGATTTFTWTATAGVTQAWIWVGTTAGGQNLGSYGGAGVTSATPTNLPVNGSTVYVRLWSLLSTGSWVFNDYTYTAASPALAVMISPAPGSVLPGASTTFTWTTNAGIAQAWMWVGTTAGGQNLGSYGGAGVTSATPTNLPTNGSTVYIRLWSFVGGSWLFNDYTYTAF
jgi:hypothetical protein